jgi:membrane-bound metal-dependent hydrolase YbcI (DUF457 family)
MVGMYEQVCFASQVPTYYFGKGSFYVKLGARRICHSLTCIYIIVIVWHGESAIALLYTISSQRGSSQL